MDVYNDKLHTTLENILESADIHSGIDLKFNELGDLVLKCYGSMYHYVPDNVTLETVTEYHIIPVNDNNERINLYEDVFGDVTQDFSLNKDTIKQDEESIEL